MAYAIPKWSKTLTGPTIALTRLARTGLGDWTQEIKLDYDTTQWGQVEKRLSRYISYLRGVAKDAEVKRTRRGYHIVITTDTKLTDKEINGIQALLGDDPVRVRMNNARLARGEKPWNRLWQMKFKVDGTIVGQEIPAPGETKSLKLMLFSDDLAFKRFRNDGPAKPKADW